MEQNDSYLHRAYCFGGGGLGKTDTNHINTNIPIDIDEASYDIIQCDRLKFVLRFMCPSP